ncbi:MAG: ABC transporter substrate-binding protein, partial [Deferribacterales bacterium]
MKKLLISSVVAAVVAAGSISYAAELPLGIQGPETGNLATYGQKTLAGAKLAVDEINASGGINGNTLKLINYDSRGDKAEAANIIQRFINKDKVCGVIGEPTSGATFVIGPIANKAKLPLISAGATADGVVEKKPFVFRNTLLDSDGAPATLKYLMNTKKWKNFVLITSVNNDYSVGMSKLFRDAAKKFKANIVAEQKVSDGDKDFSAQVTSIKNTKFDAILYTGYYPEAALLLLELRKQGINAPIVGGDGLLSPELWKVAKDAALGSIIYAGFSPEAKAKKVQEFVNKMKSRGEADMFSAQGYDAVYLFAVAMKKAKTTNCADVKQREAIRNALANLG